MNRAAAFAILVGTCVLASPSLSHAHIRVVSPTPRSDADNLKAGPCGPGMDARGLNPVLLRSGSLLRLEWEETIGHPSHYRISFDADGQDDFGDPPDRQAYYSNDAVLMDALADEDGRRGFVSADVPLPDIECENCTLQLIQVMYDKPPYEVGGNDIYYACVDLTLRRDAPCSDVNVSSDGVTCDAPDGGAGYYPDAGAAESDAGAGDASSGGSSGGSSSGGYAGGGTGGSGTPARVSSDPGGCSVARSGPPSASTLALLGLALVLARRRR